MRWCRGVALYFEDYASAIEFYTRVLGPPGYVEGVGTRGWKLGNVWLTLLKGGAGSPQNVEVILEMASVAEAERLQQAFIQHGASGPDPFDSLMYEPLHMCPVSDPFGTQILIVGSMEGQHGTHEGGERG